MIHFMLKFGGVFTLLFTLCIALIRAQPYDDSELRAFLTPPESCPAPCFMGIRPGVTTMEEAVAILEAHEWIEIIDSDIMLDGGGGYSGSISWEWSGLQPNWFDTNKKSRVSVGTDGAGALWIFTNFTLGDFWLTYGAPELNTILGNTEIGPLSIYYEGWYPDHDFVYGVDGICPVTDYWSLKVYLLLAVDVSRRLQNLRMPRNNFPWQMPLACFRRMNE